MQPNAKLLEFDEHRHDRIMIFHDHGFGDLQPEAVTGKPDIPQDALDVLGQPSVGDLSFGDIHVDRQRLGGGKLLPPGAQLSARLLEHPPADGHDQPGLLGHGNEVCGRNDAALRVVPADQGLEADDPSGLELHDRLVEKLKLIPFDRQAKIVLRLQSSYGLSVHGLVEDLVAGLACRLGSVHGRVGVAQYVLGTLVSGRAQRNADAAAGSDVVAREMKRLRDGVLDALGDPAGVRVVSEIVKQNDELVSTKAGEELLIRASQGVR